MVHGCTIRPAIFIFIPPVRKPFWLRLRLFLGKISVVSRASHSDFGRTYPRVRTKFTPHLTLVRHVLWVTGEYSFGSDLPFGAMPPIAAEGRRKKSRASTEQPVQGGITCAGVQISRSRKAGQTPGARCCVFSVRASCVRDLARADTCSMP